MLIIQYILRYFCIIVVSNIKIWIEIKNVNNVILLLYVTNYVIYILVYAKVT